MYQGTFNKFKEIRKLKIFLQTNPLTTKAQLLIYLKKDSE